MPRYVLTLAFSTGEEHSVVELKRAMEAMLEGFNPLLDDDVKRVVIRSVDED